MRAPVALVLAMVMAPPAFSQQAPAAIAQRVDFVHRRARFDLPRPLAEVSGLAVSEDGRLFAHGDERGIVYTVDPATGTVDRGFQVGIPAVTDDFEGLATAGERLFLASSSGRLYEFRAAREGDAAPVRVTDLGLEGSCEVEGLAYHAPSGMLLAACKTLRPGGDEVRIHRIPIAPGAKAPPPIRVSLTAFEARGHHGAVNPSGLDVDPATGRIVVVAARQEMLFEIDVHGRLLDLVRFPGRRHPQAEGIAWGADGSVYIADEAAGGPARITVYGPRSGGPA